jgi:hypothetical protein
MGHTIPSLEFCRSGLRPGLKWFHGTKGESARAPAPIGQKAERAADCRTLETAQAVTATRGTGLAPRSRARRFTPAGFSFALVRPGDLLALPLRQLISRCDRFRRPGKSSGPPPFAPSLNVQGHVTHNDSGVFDDLTPSIAKQLPEVVGTAVGTTVFRIRIELIFRRCWNLVTPSRSCRGVAGSGPRPIPCEHPARKLAPIIQKGSL